MESHSVHHTISLSLFHSYSLLCSSMRLFSPETVLHELLQHSPSNELLFFPNCSSMDPFHGVMSPASKTAATWASLFMCPQVLPTHLLQHRLPTGLQPLSGTCSKIRSSRGYRWIHLHCDPPCAAGTQLLCYTLHHRLQRNLCCDA